MYSVLIVEDDSAQLFLLSEHVTRLGYTVLQAASKKEAMLILGSGVWVDLLLTDFKLPDGNGAEILALMGIRNPRIMTVLISGIVSPITKHSGFDDYIIKPALDGMVEATLRSCMQVREQREYDIERGDRAA